jgi:peptidoglycan hydrolase-like protein with peptidoglycan-binding domain
MVGPGTYPIKVTTANGTSNSEVLVVAAQSANAPTVSNTPTTSNITPSQGTANTSVTTLQQEIASLTAQLQALEAQLAAAGGSTATWCHTFNGNLSIGMSGSDVTALQTALQKDGESTTINGAFDDQTAAAVTTFQQKYQSAILAPYGLSNGTGYAGKGTRAQLNSLFGCTE